MHGRAQRHRRDRPGGDGDHLLDHRGVHARGLHGRRRRRVVPALRAHRGDLGAGEPVHLLHARPDAVGLLGRPGRLPRSSREARHAACWLQRFNAWFDHQADRYGNVIAWALHHRRWMTADRGGEPSSGALALQATFGGSSFLPASDCGIIADRRAHALVARASTTRRLKVEKAAELARTIPETKATNSQVNAERRARLRRHRQEHDAQALAPSRSRADLRTLDGAAGRRRVRGARRPQQRRAGSRCRSSSPAPTRAGCMEITNDFMEKLRQVPGRGRRGPVGAGAEGRAARSSSTAAWPTRWASRWATRRRRCAWPSPASRWATGSIPTGESRDVAVRLHPDDRVDAAQHRAPADRGDAAAT